MSFSIDFKIIIKSYMKDLKTVRQELDKNRIQIKSSTQNGSAKSR